MTNPYGRAMAQMASVFAELERAMIRERTKAAMKVKRSRREYMSHQVPFGWDLASNGILIENRQEQATIRKSRSLGRHCANGQSEDGFTGDKPTSKSCG
jgi:DNA invertase Pin-like site-specific DNA recombinase